MNRLDFLILRRRILLSRPNFSEANKAEITRINRELLESGNWVYAHQAATTAAELLGTPNGRLEEILRGLPPND